VSFVGSLECGLCNFIVVDELLSRGFELDSAERQAARACSLICSGRAAFTWADVLRILGGNTMPCNTTHSGGRVQGAGKCCQLVQSGQLVPPPAGTTLPAYTPGSSGTLPANRRAQTTDASGHCSTCMIVGSSSRKHPGKPVLRFIRGGPGCPTSGTGCCAMAGA
jgi:hypothetical protein